MYYAEQAKNSAKTEKTHKQQKLNSNHLPDTYSRRRDDPPVRWHRSILADALEKFPTSVHSKIRSLRMFHNNSLPDRYLL